MFPLLIPPLIEGVAWTSGSLGVAYLIDSFFNDTPTTSNKLPVGVPPNASLSPTIPTKKPIVKTKTRSKDLSRLFDGVRNNSNTNIQNTSNSYTNNVTNITNNYNNQQAITNNVKNMPTTTLVDTLAANGAGTLALKSSLDELVAVTASGTAVTSYVGGAIFDKLDSISVALYVIASAIYENGVITSDTTPDNTNINTNIFDTAPLVSAIDSLKDIINPPARADYYSTSKAVNDYKLTPKPYSDAFGNDTVSLSPLDIRTKKDLAVGVSSSLENDTKVSDIGLDDISQTYDNLGDIFKIFNFNGISDNLKDISDIDFENLDLSTFTPDVNLKA